MGKPSRDKGKRGELEAAKRLGDLLGLPLIRSAQADGKHSADVIAGEGEPLPLHLEIKRTERFRLYDALDQAAEDAGPEQVPIVLHRPNRRPWVAVLFLDDLLPFVEAVEELLGDI